MPPKRPAEKDPELDLTPIMNMVIILIPLLLLSLVFVEVSVINVTAPKLSAGAPQEKKEETVPLNLTVTLSYNGIIVAAEGGTLPPEDGCPAESQVTLCLKDANANVKDKFEQARRKIADGDVLGGEPILNEALEQYRWRPLYNRLIEIKKKFPNETVVNIAAEPDMPFGAIIRAMDVTRYKMEKDSYGNDNDFWQALPARTKNEKGEDVFSDLFADPVFAVAK
jgi:biopolymer transport protein ExbD